MRELPELWPGAARIQWGCVLMRMLGEDSLKYLPVVLTGLRSIEGSRQLQPHLVAIRTARRLLGDLITKRAVQNAAYEFLDDQTGARSFDLDARTLGFREISAYDANIARATEILLNGLAFQKETRGAAAIDKDLVVRLDADRGVHLRLNGIRFPEPARHDISRRPRRPIEVTWDELRELAAELDGIDRNTPIGTWEGRRSPEEWLHRLNRMQLQVSNGSGFAQSARLRLDGLQHLIGLPGAGKTTLITLMCVLLARRGLRVAVFFPSIEVAREYLARLRRYGVRTALLVGRSGDTHARHANRLAELIAASGGGGFAKTDAGVDLLAQSCPLPAFASEWPDDWPQGYAPCEQIEEAGNPNKRFCPAWQLCGRVKNQRELVDASVWVGHVLSADTSVPGHTSPLRMRFFELLASTFDLVVVDECDEAQRVLDAYGALTLKLTGDDSSFHIQLQRLTGVLAANRGRVSDGLLRYIIAANEFERHMLWFVAAIRHLQRYYPAAARRYEDNLLTANFLLREAVSRPAKGAEQPHNERLSALSDFWESAMYKAFFARHDDQVEWLKAAKYASILGITTEEATSLWKRLNATLRRYLASDHSAALQDHIAEALSVLATLIRPSTPAEIEPQVRMLIAAGFAISAYQRLAKMARPLASRREIPDEFVISRASFEMREIVPRSILGTFSSVRFRRSATGHGLEIDYLVMDSTPRLLLRRLHELNERMSTNVLLTSATSWLEASSEYHVVKQPDYLLRPRKGDSTNVRLYFLPKPHPVTGDALRFSGEGQNGEENLRLMVDALAARGAGGTCDLERAVRASTTDNGRPRKAALIVNSYDQVRSVVEAINRRNPDLASRTRGILRALPEDDTRNRYGLRGEVEVIGADPKIDVLVFPMSALGRGVNLVFKTADDDDGRASVGSIYFLTRPHPAAGDLGLLISLLARSTEQLDAKDLSALGLDEASRLFDQERYRIYQQVSRLLARPMSVSKLEDQTLTTFAANLLVPVIQTIGRGLRRGMPVEVYFVDAAWAPNSTRGDPETRRSSVLVTMREVLRTCLNAADPVSREVYRAAFGAFAEAFEAVDGVVYPGPLRTGEEEAPLQVDTWALEDGDEIAGRDAATRKEQYSEDVGDHEEASWPNG